MVFLKRFKVKNTFFFKSNTLISDKINLLVAPIFGNTFSFSEYHFDINFLQYVLF